MNATLKVEDIIFGTRAEAEDALFKLEKYAKTYGSARVSDLYELAGLYNSYRESKYIWFPHQLKDSNVLRVRNGYIIDLPPANYDGSTSKVTYREYSPKKPTTPPKPTPKTLTITLDYAGIDDFDEVFAKVLQYAQTITDREVQIDIT